MKRSIADTNIRKITTVLNKLPELTKLPISNIMNREVTGIQGNKIRVRLDSSFIVVDIRNIESLDPNVQSAVVGALKKERSNQTEDYLIEQALKGVKFNKAQLSRLESRGIKYVKERVAKIQSIGNIDKLAPATKGMTAYAVEGAVRGWVENELSDIKNTDNLFEMLYFSEEYYGASGYNKGEILGFIDWLATMGYADLDEMLFDMFDYTEELEYEE